MTTYFHEFQHLPIKIITYFHELQHFPIKSTTYFHECQHLPIKIITYLHEFQHLFIKITTYFHACQHLSTKIATSNIYIYVYYYHGFRQKEKRTFRCRPVAGDFFTHGFCEWFCTPEVTKLAFACFVSSGVQYPPLKPCSKKSPAIRLQRNVRF